MRKQHIMLLAALLAGAAWSARKLVAAQNSTPNRSAQLQQQRGLSNISDVKEFAAQLQDVHNPHILQTAKVLLDQSSQPRTEAYALQAAMWQSPQIQVCWENPSANFSSQMAMVQQAIAGTWQAASKLRFIGWQQCPGTSTAGAQVVRIEIDDSGPRTLGLGKQLNGIQHGMLLNFTFLHWSPACQTMTDYCIKGIAVHEFGHAIGFAHEQNRPDKPGECQEAPQGENGDVLLTPYDPNSVMNYCNKKYNNDGNLSALDKDGVQKLYGQP